MATRMSEEVLDLKQHLIEDITAYMKYGGAEDEHDPDYDPDWDSGYKQKHIDAAEDALDRFIAELERMDGGGTEEEVMQAVKAVVLTLNDINGQTRDGSMIETGQREQLCEIILAAAQQAGLETDDDLTAEWRDW